VDAGAEIELEQAQFFRAMKPDLLDRVRPLVLEKRFQRRRVLFFDGHQAAYLWVVRRGQVRLYKSSSDGSLTTLETLDPGEVFGAVSALDEERYPASAEGVTDGVAWCLGIGVVRGLLQEEPELAGEILRIVSGRLHEAHERLRSFARDPARARLAQALLRAARQGEAQVTRRALAEAAGTTVETAIRVLRRFERDGIIRGEVGRVHVLDEARLRQISGGPPA
jgi:CRP/FNR family transcriptional regulator